VPGAFIAMMAGAVLWDIKLGEYVSASSFLTNLLRPGGRSMKYVLAANKTLLDHAVEALVGSSDEVATGGDEVS
jgi:hypothetical protein